MRDFLGTLSSSVKHIKAPYLFDWKQGIALHAIQGKRASSFGEGVVSWFSRVAAEPGKYSRVTAGVAINNFSLFSDVRTPV